MAGTGTGRHTEIAGEQCLAFHLLMMVKLGLTRFVGNDRTSTTCFPFGWKESGFLREHGMTLMKIHTFWDELLYNWLCCPFFGLALQCPVRIKESFLCLHFFQLFENESLSLVR
jgi:hypothetical protein